MEDLSKHLNKITTKRHTIKEWLEMIEDPGIRSQALANMFLERADDMVPSQRHALRCAFLWRRSAEGYVYWELIHDQL